MTREVTSIASQPFPWNEGFAPVLQHATEVGIETKNVTLLDYCADYTAQYGNRLPDTVLDAKAHLENEVAAGHLLRWLDVPVDANDGQKPPAILTCEKIVRSLQQTRNIWHGSGYACYVAVPALNEEDQIGELVNSFRQKPSETPIALILADNNSTDQTAEVVRNLGGNIVHASRPGIGPACQVAVDHIMKLSVCSPEHTLILRTDADCIADPSYADAVTRAFARDQDMLVGIGPSVYSVPQEDGTILTIDKGQMYGDMFGTKGLRACFKLAGRDADDYLLPGGRHRYLAGPNTTLRLSLFKDPEIRFPNDRRWEMVDLAVRIQRAHSPSSIVRVEGQRMQVSSRAILGDSPYLTKKRAAEIRRNGYVPVFSGSGGQTPYTTMRLVVDDIDRSTYGLSIDERVLAVTDNPPVKLPQESRRVMARHAGTKRPIGKVAIIGQVQNL